AAGSENMLLAVDLLQLRGPQLVGQRLIHTGSLPFTKSRPSNGLHKIPRGRNNNTTKPASRCLPVPGDPYGNRTHVTAVKGRCLNRLTNGPNGSGNLTRTDDTPGMNRMLYQLSYAAM